MNATQIIQRSIDATPNEFRAALIAQAEMHDDYATGPTRDIRARQGAIASRNACLAAYDAVGQADTAAIVAKCGTMIVALNVACKLQGLPAHVRTAAAVAWQDERDAQTPEAEGLAAQRAGVKWWVNPYLSGSELAGRWDAGHTLGRKQS